MLASVRPSWLSIDATAPLLTADCSLAAAAVGSEEGMVTVMAVASPAACRRRVAGAATATDTHEAGMPMREAREAASWADFVAAKVVGPTPEKVRDTLMPVRGAGAEGVVEGEGEGDGEATTGEGEGVATTGEGEGEGTTGDGKGVAGLGVALGLGVGEEMGPAGVAGALLAGLRCREVEAEEVVSWGPGIQHCSTTNTNDPGLCPPKPSTATPAQTPSRACAHSIRMPPTHSPGKGGILTILPDVSRDGSKSSGLAPTRAFTVVWNSRAMDDRELPILTL